MQDVVAEAVAIGVGFASAHGKVGRGEEQRQVNTGTAFYSEIERASGDYFTEQVAVIPVGAGVHRQVDMSGKVRAALLDRDADTQRADSGKVDADACIEGQRRGIIQLEVEREAAVIRDVELRIGEVFQIEGETHVHVHRSVDEQSAGTSQRDRDQPASADQILNR